MRNKKYNVYIEPKYALDVFNIKAKTKKEAKQKAYDRLRKSDFKFNVEKEE